MFVCVCLIGVEIDGDGDGDAEVEVLGRWLSRTRPGRPVDVVLLLTRLWHIYYIFKFITLTTYLLGCLFACLAACFAGCLFDYLHDCIYSVPR